MNQESVFVFGYQENLGLLLFFFILKIAPKFYFKTIFKLNTDVAFKNIC